MINVINVPKSDFLKTYHIGGKLATYLEVSEGTKKTRPEITKQFYMILQKRNLIYEQDKRIFRVDSETSKIFGIPVSVNDVNDHTDTNGFNFYNLQKYIQYALTVSNGKHNITPTFLSPKPTKIFFSETVIPNKRTFQEEFDSEKNDHKKVKLNNLF